MSKEELAEGRGQKDMCHLKKRREGQDANEGRAGERREGQVLRRHTGIIRHPNDTCCCTQWLKMACLPRAEHNKSWLPWIYQPWFLVPILDTGVFLDRLLWVVPDLRDVESSVENAICSWAGQPASGCCDCRRCRRVTAFGLCLHAKGNVIMCECHGDCIPVYW